MKTLEKLFIVGRNRLEGTVGVSGAKNAALSILAASLLAEGEITIENVPMLSDVYTQIEILRLLDAKLKINDSGVLNIDPTNSIYNEVPYELTKKSRGSILFMAPMLAKFHKVKIGLPGGDALGPRPINLHLKGFKVMGANVVMKENSVEITAEKLKGARVFLDRPSTTATENIMIAATLAEGLTVIENAEKVPEIVDLAKFLKSMGAKIKGEETGVIMIKGVKNLIPTCHKLIPDPFEANTYMVASAITEGDVFVDNAIPDHVIPTVAKLREVGAKVEMEKNVGIRVVGKTINPVSIYVSAPYPAFQSDMQPIFTALTTLAKGTSSITDSVFPQRFGYITELKKMGADIRLRRNTCFIRGVKRIIGASVTSEDIRGGAALILAGLAAEGETIVDHIFHIDRGYQNIEEKLGQLGARIYRT
jgi:UDP-N-acetylglucosamine 1-carboxyvinyltransferase